MRQRDGVMMEPKQQLEAWQAQIEAAPKAGVVADMGVAKRLVAHGLQAIAEIDRLTRCLAAANSRAEHFERQWYLRGDVLEAVREWDVSSALDSNRPTLLALPHKLRAAIEAEMPHNNQI